MAGRSTLFTSPKSAGDFVVRVIFFALAPIAIVRAAALFPVIGALVSVALALGVFLLGEAIRARAVVRPWLSRVFKRQLALEAYYRARPPRPFLYYVLYPALFPYWLVDREARREFVLFKGFTLGSFAVLLASTSIQYFLYWSPDLTIDDYLPVFGMTLAVEWVLVLALLMPLATTVVGFHASMRRGRLVALLAVGLLSTGLAISRLARRRDPVISFATRERVELRTSRDHGRAHEAQMAGLGAAFLSFRVPSGTPARGDGEGRIEGEPLEAAYVALGRFYKTDESRAFELWASPRKSPEILVLFFEARRSRPAIWAALRRDGTEVTDPKQLPKGALAAMRQATKE